MSNPTTGNDSQFNSPFNILPDTIYLNQTGKPSNQFTAPFNILPDLFGTKNPTIGLINPTQNFDILPNTSLGRLNPTSQQQYQFNTPLQMGNYQTFDILPNPIGTRNPTIGNTSIRNPGTPGPLQMGSFTTYDIVDFPDPSIPLLTPYTKPAPIYIPGEALPTQYFTNWYYNRFRNVQYRFNAKSQTLQTNIVNIGNALGGSFAGASTLLGLTAGLSFTPNLISTIGGNQFNTPYATLTQNQLKNSTGALRSEVTRLLDFRSRIKSKRVNRNDGRYAAGVGSVTAGEYMDAAQSKEGAYSTFYLSAPGKYGSGWGEHDAPGADRSDFTVRTEVATKWDIVNINWNPIERPTDSEDNPLPIVPFRGDKVNVIDFKRSQTLSDTYRWKPDRPGAQGTEAEYTEKYDPTQDFIKFYFTGPKLQNGAPDTTTDDIMVFRAMINNLDDSFNANWTPVNLIGRADPNYHYTGYSRDLSLGFDIYATSRDELKFIWRKLNALAGYTAPQYSSEDIALRAPWMRITIGDIFVQQPVVLNSLNYTYDTDASWEINIEDDPTNMQVPFKIGVTCQFNMITDYLPQKDGRFFTLAKRFAGDSRPIEGDDNWLSDFLGNTPEKPNEPIPEPTADVVASPISEQIGGGSSDTPIAQD
jgi:hypothetical protein